MNYILYLHLGHSTKPLAQEKYISIPSIYWLYTDFEACYYLYKKPVLTDSCTKRWTICMELWTVGKKLWPVCMQHLVRYAACFVNSLRVTVGVTNMLWSLWPYLAVYEGDSNMTQFLYANIKKKMSIKKINRKCICTN